MYRILICLMFLHVVIAKSKYVVGKGSVVDFALKTFHQDGLDVESILQSVGKKSFTILRERLDDIDFGSHDSTGLSIVLDYDDCTHEMCVQTKARDDCDADEYVNNGTHVMKLVIRRDSTITDWLVDCLLYAKVELPSDDGGIPGARTGAGDAPERGRLSDGVTDVTDRPVTDEEEMSNMNVETQTVKTISVSAPVSASDSNETETAPDCSDDMFKSDMFLFHTECCMKRDFAVAARDHRCSLSQMMNKVINDRDATSTTPATKTTNDASDTGDVSRLGKSLDLDGDNVNTTETGYENEAAEVMFQEMSGELSGWKSKYYVVLGFFLVFFAFFLIVIAVLVYKLKTKKTGAPPASPGAGLSVPVQRGRGYSAIEGDNDGDTAPLTPATQQAQAFQY